jgi:diaminopimelate decarboxylase/aspartate kinase
MDGVSARRWVVLKFGGTSMADPKLWPTIARVIGDRSKEGLTPVVVCSALSGITNGLEKLLHEAMDGRQAQVLVDIRTRHMDLGKALGVEAEPLLREDLAELERVALGLCLVGEVTPRVHARVLAMGELLSTRLAAAYLRLRGLPALWVDARECLISEDEGGPRRKYLSATCSTDLDRGLALRLTALAPRVRTGSAPSLPDAAVPEPEVFITQGFIAGAPNGHTVLLGRGGSDTSASYFAAKLSAVRCEIWTDVLGMYSADPRQAPEARLIRRLDYDEAQEIASTGGKVLHPRCIAPLWRHGIPLHIRSTLLPDAEGTIIAPGQPDRGAEVKAIASRTGITLISMETVGMWQQVGFLADVFTRFKEQGISIDMVSTSETNVTVSLDPAGNALAPEAIPVLLDSLGAICQAKRIGPCSAVSLVGRNIRGVLPRLGPALAAFEEQKIHLVSQAANDLNLTFVVDEDQAERLVRRLHEMLFGGRQGDPLLGPSWRELGMEEPARVSPAPPVWWVSRREDLLALASGNAPCYVYDPATIDEAADRLRSIEAADRILYAIKANPHPAILERLHKRGIGFECTSWGEVDHVLRAIPGIPPGEILFTPNFAPREEYARSLARDVRVTVDNIHPLRFWPELFRGREIFLRVDPGVGRGHHRYVRTGGADSKFGLSPDQLDEVAERIREDGIRVTGLHAHTGSGISDADNWSETALFLAAVADRFPEVRILDVGGGLGVPEHPGQSGLDVTAMGELLRQVREARPELDLWLEPGRYLVAHAGVLLARVTQIKRKGDRTYVGIETGMNSLIRPSLYGAWHQIVNLTRLDEPANVRADIVGPICESGDVLGHARAIAAPEEGDVILIATTGAYGRCMSSRYNLREPAEEHMLAG